jgi:hypothetical protein
MVRRIWINRIKLLVVGTVVALAAAALPVVTTLAADEKAQLHPGISNGKTEGTNSSYAKFSLEPGEHYKDSFKFYNLGSEDFDVNLSVTPYSVTDEQYTADQTTQTPRTQISRWITFPKNDFIIPSGEDRVIEYEINVPRDVPSGGQYARIIASAKLLAPTDTNMVGDISLGYTIFATIDDGNTRDNAQVIRHKIPFFYFSGPIGDIAAVQNDGNTDAMVTHQITISDYFSKNTVYESEKIDGFVLPDTTRALDLQWDNVPVIGLFKVKSTITIGNDNFVKDGIVLVVPLWFIITVIVVLALIVWLLISKAHDRKQGRAAKPRRE